MPRPLREKSGEQKQASDKKRLNNRVSKVENKLNDSKDIHEGFPKNPKSTDLARADGKWYGRNSNNTAWEELGGSGGLGAIIVNDAASLPVLTNGKETDWAIDRATHTWWKASKRVVGDTYLDKGWEPVGLPVTVSDTVTIANADTSVKLPFHLDFVWGSKQILLQKQNNNEINKPFLLRFYIVNTIEEAETISPILGTFVYVKDIAVTFEAVTIPNVGGVFLPISRFLSTPSP